MHHTCKGVIFYLFSFASHCESPQKSVIQYSQYILTCSPLREKADRVTLFKEVLETKLFSHPVTLELPTYTHLGISQTTDWEPIAWNWSGVMRGNYRNRNNVFASSAEKAHVTVIGCLSGYYTAASGTFSLTAAKCRTQKYLL